MTVILAPLNPLKMSHPNLFPENGFFNPHPDLRVAPLPRRGRGAGGEGYPQNTAHAFSSSVEPEQNRHG